ncbi:MAG: rhomboid family intramembrane serine protease [Verrucomicrobia bacterium]|jgi:GlpG protein|nr:rhomboid family intramembrane serine protease [Verrucomicrobiota bacterium]
MRKIGHIDETHAATLFSDYLYAQGVGNEIEGDEGSGWDVWVHNEEQLEAATREFEVYLKDPGAPRYAAAEKVAEELHRKEKKSASAFQKKVFDRDRMMKHSLVRMAPVTVVLIAISVAVTLMGGLGSGSELTQWLSITAYETVEGAYHFDPQLPELRQGQVWRLVTPIFIHATLLAQFGILHILFNMLWLKDLGAMLERSQGKRGIITKVLVLAILSNLGQFQFAGPAFGGMSGVVYGLLGYCWMRGRFDVTSGLFVHSQTVIFMTAWFFLCLFGAMGPIANGAHGVGLVAGLVWGYASAYRVNMRKIGQS